MVKRFRLDASEIRQIATGHGFCMASDHITVEGKRVGFMYRQKPSDISDSGWVFLSGEESQDYLDDANNLAFYEVNTIRGEVRNEWLATHAKVECGNSNRAAGLVISRMLPGDVRHYYGLY